MMPALVSPDKNSDLQLRAKSLYTIWAISEKDVMRYTTDLNSDLYNLEIAVRDARYKAVLGAKNLHEQVERQESELWRLQFAHAPTYPPPNSDGEWTVKVIADYYGVEERAVTRMIKERFANLSHGFGKRITLNQQQMEVVVRCLMKKPIIGKKIAEVRRRNT